MKRNSLPGRLILLTLLCAVCLFILPAPAQQVNLSSSVITPIACTNRVPDNVTESTAVGSAIDMGQYRYLGLQVKFALHAAGTETCTFNFATSADGTNYTTSGRPVLAVAANGTTPVVTNYVVDMQGLTKLKLLSIVCGNTTTADMTNILVTATKRMTPY